MAGQRSHTTHEVVLRRFTEICDAFRRGDLSQVGASTQLHVLLYIIFNSNVPPVFLKKTEETLRIQKELLVGRFGLELRTFWVETIQALKNRIVENEREEAALQGMREGPDCVHCNFTMQPHGTGFKCPNCDATIVTKPA